ncbi:MAG: alpha/beta hydrolase [Bacteroidales bacterium]|nr:alpha/beta hydrolase [Bacteroidales bacterium]
MAVICLSAASAGEIQRQDFHVASEPGIELAVREVVDLAAPHDGSAVILVHGARVPGVASFDLPVAGGSLAADLAHAGHRVFIMDVRGYGGSTRPAAMSQPPEGKPLVTSNEVVRDIDAVVGWVTARTGRAAVALLGWATGGHWAGMYASLKPQVVSHLVIYNALYGAHAGHPSLGPGSDAADPQNPARFDIKKFSAYRLNTAASLLPSWDRTIPGDDKNAWHDPQVVAAYQAGALASDPESGRHSPPAFRAPSGAMEDSFYLASGRQLWDAAPITAAVLIIRSERDFWSRPEDVTKLREHLVNAAGVRTVNIPSATHYVHLDRADKGRALFLSEVTTFLAGDAAH